jgi:hypothetical protein
VVVVFATVFVRSVCCGEGFAWLGRSHRAAQLINRSQHQYDQGRGDPSLDQGAIALVRALHDHSGVAVRKADAQIVAACEDAVIPLGTVNP